MTTLTGVISFPIPAFQNIPINANFYQPSVFAISNISLGTSTTITTIVNHNYVIGQEIRLIIPRSFGCIELNHRTGYVLSIPALNQIMVSINSYGGNTYIASTNKIESAQIVAIGDINSGAINVNGPSLTSTFINGSFMNISPG